MKRTVFLYALLCLCLVTDGIALVQAEVKPDVKPGARKECPFSIIGMWKAEATIEANTIFYSFSPDGWVRLVGHSATDLPREYEVIAEVKYTLDKPAAPKRIEFTSRRGNGVFPAGATSLEITEYSDDTFITENPESRDQIRWVRAQTHRYFLTFAARSGLRQHGGSAFAMWTTLDGRQTKIEALGMRLTKESGGGAVPVFGPIPAQLYNEFANESGKASDVMMRLELNEAEFERTHKVFEIWNEYVRTAALPYDNPYLNGMEFLKRAAESLNQCDEKVKLHTLDRSTTDDLVARQNLHQQLLEYIKALRKKNRDLHVTDGMFPTEWHPMRFPDGH